MLLVLLSCTREAGELQRCSIAAPESTTLRVDGTELIDEHDRVVQLRGVNAGGRSKFAPYAPFEFEDYDEELGPYLDRAASWGIDVLRVPFSWEAVEPAQGVIDEAFLSRYDALLDGAWDRGMWTIVDFHQDIYAEVFCGDGFPAWTVDTDREPHHDCSDWGSSYFLDDDVQAAFTDFWADENGTQEAYGAMWEAMAARHADRPGVLGYELINEPHEGEASDWDTEVLPAFYSEHAARLQAIDDDAIVFFDVGGLDGISVSTDLELPEGDNLVFAPHYYNPQVYLGGSLEIDVPAEIAGWHDQGVDWDVPVLVGEFGVQPSREGAAEYVARHFQAFDELDLHGTVWEYSTAEELWNEEDFSLVEADGTERETVVSVMRPYAKALAGELVEQSWSGGTFTLRYTAEPGGISEIVVPSRLAEDPALQGSGACARRSGDALYLKAEAGDVELRIEL